MERTRAVNQTRDFLYELIDPKKTPRVPKSIRQQAHHLLRHYPNQHDMQLAAAREDYAYPNPLAYRVFGESWK
jgi:hypothetical protein